MSVSPTPAPRPVDRIPEVRHNASRLIFQSTYFDVEVLIGHNPEHWVKVGTVQAISEIGTSDNESQFVGKFQANYLIRRTEPNPFIRDNGPYSTIVGWFDDIDGAVQAVLSMSLRFNLYIWTMTAEDAESPD